MSSLFALLLVKLPQQEFTRRNELSMAALKLDHFQSQSSCFLLQEIPFLPQYLQIFQDRRMVDGVIMLLAVLYGLNRLSVIHSESDLDFMPQAVVSSRTRWSGHGSVWSRAKKTKILAVGSRPSNADFRPRGR